MTSSRVLVVDDEANVRFVLKNALKHEGYQIDTAIHGADAIQKFRETPYDLLLLDLHMEPVDGLTVLNFVREQDPLAVVIILTAYSSVESAVEALRLGAFDYLFKPASPQTIREQVQAGIKHRQESTRQRQLLNQLENLRQTLSSYDSNEPLASSEPERRFLHTAHLVIDIHRRQATLEDTHLELTTTEFDLLTCLVKTAPKPVSPRQLVNCAMGYDVDEVEARNNIKWHIYQLRQKVEPDPSDPTYIITVRHKGYMWRDA